MVVGVCAYYIYWLFIHLSSLGRSLVTLATS